ncbi:hypothetical protein CDD81_1332 [Ophiocordyceps australis]|uniref:Only prolin and serin are matching in the corresponding protein n=1 Tax=Ophiocordyceps australis TaxID=1399860 RepID=A0A2C5Y178_9HYPO|nr:hypothetical protein CDD81_1332 [Ophiocordyceps australis]
MSPKLKPLLLPQIVERRRQVDSLATDNGDVSQVYYTTNSSCSDVTSPLTPTFSARGHQRLSSSTSSLELPPQSYEIPSSPVQLLAAKPDKTPLPDVEEERYDDDDDAGSEYFGLYSCLCDNVCPHRNSAEGFFPESVAEDSDIDYDMGFLSDGDFSADLRVPKKRSMVDSSPFAALTSRLGSRLPTIKRWRSSRRNASKLTPLGDVNFGNELSREPSSRSSSISASHQHMTESRVNAFATAPSSISCLSSDDILCTSPVIPMTPEEHSNLEVERSMATTPLLPPLLTDPLQKPPPESPIESPLQSPTVAPPSAATLVPGPSSMTPRSSRPPLSSRPSLSSLRQISSSGTDLPLSLPSIMQDHDEWSDRLGHANFTITPIPYQPDCITTETVQKFLSDRNLASSNYAKHLLRVKEHYGHTSMIYAMTEMKWEETQTKWKSIYEAIFNQNCRSAPASTNHSRNHSRGRGRGRSSSSVGAVGRLDSNDDYLADVEWRRVDDCHPGAVPRMLESLNAHGKFPCRGEEDIVGLMERETVMVRARSEDAKGRFWRNIVDKVGLRK